MNKTTPTYEVTIGIPVYNIEKYIRAMMDSALAQTFESIEFLICDDCGTDASIDIVKEYQQTHPRGRDIRVVRQPHNMGIGEGRNRMLAEARGKFFYSLDGDDTIAPNAIELLHRAAMEHHAEMVHGSYDRIYIENGEYVKTVPHPYPQKVFTRPDEYAEYAYNVGVACMNWNFLIDVDVVRRNHLRVTPVGHGYGEDFTSTIDLPTYVTRVVLLPDITYHYYMRKNLTKSKRTHPICRRYMDLAIEAIDQKKRRTDLRHKSYYAKRCSILLMHDFSFACRILQKGDDIDVPYTDEDIRRIMWHPMSIGAILCARQARLKNLVYYLIGVLYPPKLAVMALRVVGKLRGRI